MPLLQTVGGGEIQERALLKSRREYRLCVLYVVSAESQGVKGASHRPASKHRYSTSSKMCLRDRRLNLAITQLFWEPLIYQTS